MNENQSQFPPPQSPPFVFEAGPGWGGKLSRWLKNNFLKLIIALIIGAAVAGIIFLLTERKEIPQTLQTETPESQILPEGVIIKERKEEGKLEAEEVFALKAQKGEGITHLARKALKEYLKLNPSQGADLTAEHKIYIEDYLKDKKGERYLELGEEIEFSFSDIAQAIEAAKGLSESQLRNLSQYVPSVRGL